nr:nicotinate phosphoribosyltransferase 2-like [Ipomoea batatas]
MLTRKLESTMSEPCFVDYGIFDLESSFINVNPRGFAHFCIHMRILNILSAAIMHLFMLTGAFVLGLVFFDLYFRKNPFGGEYTIFAGLEECIKLIANFKFREDDIAFLRQSLPSSCEDGFFEYLRSIVCSDVEIYSISEGSVVFPKVPLMRVEGPVAVAQLLETPFVNLINYASLVTTSAARHRFIAGKEKLLLEFGLRRAQGPDGGIGASKYCYMGEFDATSNVAAGKIFGIPLRGTHSHAFVSSFMSTDEIVEKSLNRSDGSSVYDDFVSLVQAWLNKLKWSNLLGGIFGETNQSELAAFTSYALAFPGSFLALVDTYDVIRSGVPNFCAVALALNDLGYKAIGIRLDSGDLAYQSCEAMKFFFAIEKEFGVPSFGKMSITASNDLNEETLDALNKQGHEVDAFGIGTHLVTCYAQAALGVVFKLVEINNQPRIKLSEDVTKICLRSALYLVAFVVSIPCKKRCYRLYGKEGYPLVDIMIGENEPPPKVGERIMCRHPFSESKRAYVVPQRVEELLKCYWPGSSGVNCACGGGDSLGNAVTITSQTAIGVIHSFRCSTSIIPLQQEADNMRHYPYKTSELSQKKANRNESGEMAYARTNEIVFVFIGEGSERLGQEPDFKPPFPSVNAYKYHMEHLVPRGA